MTVVLQKEAIRMVTNNKNDDDNEIIMTLDRNTKDNDNDSVPIVVTAKDDDDDDDASDSSSHEDYGARSTTEEEEQQQQLRQQQQESTAWNDAFCALEAMRKANLEVEFGGQHKIATMMLNRTASSTDDVETAVAQFHECCTACLYDQKSKLQQQAQQQQTQQDKRWLSRYRRQDTAWKKKQPPCLICASPVCPTHACHVFRQQHAVTICRHCANFFTQDYCVQLIASAHPKEWHYMMECYDRAWIMLHYSCQFIDEIAAALQERKQTNNQIGLGSSSMGLMSGLTGVGAVAATVIHVGAAASLLTPAGPPLLLASLLFGGTAAAASTSTEAIQYYSEPNQVANKILALADLVHRLLAVLQVIQEVLHYKQNTQAQSQSQPQAQGAPKGPIWNDSKKHKDNMNKDPAEEAFMMQLLKSRFDEHGRIQRLQHQSSTVSLNSENNNNQGDNNKDDNEKEQDVVRPEIIMTNTTIGRHDNQNTTTNNSSSQGSLSEYSSSQGHDDNGTANDKANLDGSNDGADDNGDDNADDDDETNNHKEHKKSAYASVMPLAPLVDDVLNAMFKVLSAPSTGAQAAASSAMKVAQVATIACGALSAATIVMEGRNMHYTLKSLQAGSPCAKAQLLRNVRDEVALLPTTNVIAADCELYLKQAQAQQ